MSTWTYSNIKGQGQVHSLNLVQGHSDSTFSNFFFLETARSIEAKFYVEPQREKGTKVCSNGLGLMNQYGRPAHTVYGKNLKTLLLQNKTADDLETWYAALDAWVLPFV